MTRVDRNSGSGLFVELSHGFGYTTLYAHLKKHNVKEGQSVKRHDVIAYVGNSGRSTGPHLHYEVRYQGKPVKSMAKLRLDISNTAPGKKVNFERDEKQLRYGENLPDWYAPYVENTVRTEVWDKIDMTN